MEVHHHSGDHHGPKKFKDYFLEFLMIFLAVTLGFLAENFREVITAKSHVKELAGQLKEDLMNDTANLQRLIQIETIQLKRTDSLFTILTQPPKQIDYIRLQELVRNCEHIDLFYPSTGAMSTIKLELHLKEFVRTKIASYIDNYEKDVNVLKAFELRDVDYMGKYLETFMLKHFTPENAAAIVNQKPFVSGAMRDITPEDLVQLSVDITLIKGYNRQLLIRYNIIKSNAEAFIRHISKTYEIGDD
jgi:hypothetical protein